MILDWLARGRASDALAIGALAIATPWGAMQWPLAVVVAVGIGLLLLARPQGRQWLTWLVPALAVVIRIVPAPPQPSEDALHGAFAKRCESILRVARSAAEEPRIVGLLAGEGEALDPDLPFRLLDRAASQTTDLSLYLADERGRIVAWGGRDRRYPDGFRTLGQRQWGISWTAATVRVVLREPLLLEGRLVGAITAVESAPLVTDEGFGLKAPFGWHFAFGGRDSPLVLRNDTAAGIALPIDWLEDSASGRVVPPWVLWVAMSALIVPFGPGLALAAGFLAIVAVHQGARSGTCLGLSIAVLVVAFAANRWFSSMAPAWRRVGVVSGLTLVVALSLVLARSEPSFWLPAHLMPPGFGAVWLVAAVWLMAAWPVRRWDLERRLLLAGVAAGVAALVNLAAIAFELSHDKGAANHDIPAAGGLDDREIHGLLDESQYIGDLAPVLARQWGLDEWSTGIELVVIDASGAEVSRWGDLTGAAGRSSVHSQWTLLAETGLQAQLRTVSEPWSLLRDWSNSGGLESSDDASIWWVVLTRSGTVAASLHPDVRPLDPYVAGSLYHHGGGWRWMEIAGERFLARIRREGPWLVAKVAHQPPAVTWFIRMLSGALWALLVLFFVCPPTRRPRRRTTFSGRLRMLVASAVVVPLAVLAVLFHFRVRAQDRLMERAAGTKVFRAARYTVEHLAEGLVVDDDLARWLAEGWGGEVTFFDGIHLLASSRRDLIEMGKLPQVPMSEAFPGFLLNRDDVIVERWKNEIVASGAVRLQGRNVLLQLTSEPPVGARESPRTFDWLVSVSAIAALLALVLSGRVSGRLTHSLNILVSLSRRLLHGDPVREVDRPKEHDLSEVLEAVLLMARAVQEREANLRNQEEMLRITLATLEPAVFVLDEASQELFRNPSADRLRSETEPETVEQVLRHEPGDELSMVTVRPVPGGDVTWRVGAAEVPLPGGGNGRVVVVEDVSDVVRAERLGQLTHMARIVAHEVKNPLTPIRLWMQELEEARRAGEKGLGPLVDEACHEILGQLERLQRTANAFSNLVALERWEPTRVDLTELVHEAVSHLDVLRRRGTEIRLATEPVGACVVTADVEWLRRAVDTVLLNSVTVIDEAHGTIEVRTRAASSWRVIEIEDDGGGVGQDRLEDLFSPHFSTTGSGTGLGLAMVRQVMTRADGKVEALNGDKGLVVRMVFPPP